MRAKMFTVGLLIAAAIGCQGEYKVGSRAVRQPYRYNRGVDGPGPGVIPMSGAAANGNIVQAGYFGESMAQNAALSSSQVNFLGPDGMTLQWDVTMPGAFDSTPLFLPGSHSFQQGAVYRLKVANIVNYEGKELYPTLEIAPVTPRTQGFLQHAAVPVEFTDNDFDQVLSGNFITKVIYLPKPEFQGLATAGVGILVNTQLEPGVDPIVEATNRGSILAIVRMGNKDLSIQANDMASNGAESPFMGGASPFRQNYISGITGPEYGQPLTSTTAGIPGPPSLPLVGPQPRSQVGIAYPMSAPPAPSFRR